MVIKDVTDGISIKINELFGDEYEIYDNNTEQGMEKPCFYINYLDGERKLQNGIEIKHYLDTLHFDITGFAQNDDRASLNDMADKLYDLEYITLLDGTLLRADSMKPKIEDGVLHFFIDYKIFIAKKDKESTKMGDYDINEEVKRDG